MIQIELRAVNISVDHTRMPYKETEDGPIEYLDMRVLVFFDPTNNMMFRVPMPDDAWEATKAAMDERPQIVIAQPGDMPTARIETPLR